MMNMNALSTALNGYFVMLLNTTAGNYSITDLNEWLRLFNELIQSKLLPTIRILFSEKTTVQAMMRSAGTTECPSYQFATVSHAGFLTMLNEYQKKLQKEKTTVSPSWLIAVVRLQHELLALISELENDIIETRQSKQPMLSSVARLATPSSHDTTGRALKIPFPKWSLSLNYQVLTTSQCVDTIIFLLNDHDNLFVQDPSHEYFCNTNMLLLNELFGVLETRSDMCLEYYIDILRAGTRVDWTLYESVDITALEGEDIHYPEINQKQIFDLLMDKCNAAFSVAQLPATVIYEIVLMHLHEIAYWYADNSNFIFTWYNQLNNDTKAQLLIDFFDHRQNNMYTVTRQIRSLSRQQHFTSTPVAGSTLTKMQTALMRLFAYTDDKRKYDGTYVSSTTVTTVVAADSAATEYPSFLFLFNPSKEKVVELFNRLSTVEVVSKVFEGYLSTWLLAQPGESTLQDNIVYLFENVTCLSAALSLCRVVNAYHISHLNLRWIYLLLSRRIVNDALFSKSEELADLIRDVRNSLLNCSDEYLAELLPAMTHAAGVYFLGDAAFKGRIQRSNSLQMICLKRNFDTRYSLSIISQFPWHLDQLVLCCIEDLYLPRVMQSALLKRIPATLAKQLKAQRSDNFQVNILNAFKSAYYHAHKRPTDRHVLIALVTQLQPLAHLVTMQQCHLLIRAVPVPELLDVLVGHYENPSDFLDLLQLDTLQGQAFVSGSKELVLALVDNAIFAEKIVETLSLATMMRLFHSYPAFSEKLIDRLLLPCLRKYVHADTNRQLVFEFTQLLERFAHATPFVKAIFSTPEFYPFISIKALQAILEVNAVTQEETACETNNQRLLINREFVCNITLLHHYTTEELLGLFSSRRITNNLQKITIMQVIVGKILAEKAGTVTAFGKIFSQLHRESIPLAVAAMIEFIQLKIDENSFWNKYTIFKSTGLSTEDMLIRQLIQALADYISHDIALILLSCDLLTVQGYKILLNDILIHKIYFNFDFVVSVCQLEGFYTEAHCKEFFAVWSQYDDTFHPVMTFQELQKVYADSKQDKISAIEKAKQISTAFFALTTYQENPHKQLSFKIQKILLRVLTQPGQKGILSENLKLAEMIQRNDPLSALEYQKWVSQHPTVDSRLIGLLYPEHFNLEDLLFLLIKNRQLTAETMQILMRKMGVLLSGKSVSVLIQSLYDFRFTVREYVKQLETDTKHTEQVLAWPQANDHMSLKAILHNLPHRHGNLSNKLNESEIYFLLKEYLSYVAELDSPQVVGLSESVWLILWNRCKNYSEYLELNHNPCRINGTIFIDFFDYEKLQKCSNALINIQQRAQVEQGYLFIDAEMNYINPEYRCQNRYTLTVKDRELITQALNTATRGRNIY